MSLFFGRNTKPERRAIGGNAAFGVGLDVNQRTGDSMSLIPLFAAHRVITDAVASTPLQRYRDNGDGSKTQLSGSNLFTGLDGTQFSFTSQCVASMLFDGNAFGYVTGFDYTGWPSSLLWLDPRKVSVVGSWGDLDSPDGPQYFYERRPLDRQRVVHIPWIMPPGKNRGLSPLANFKTSLETGQLAQKMARDYYKNQGVPRVHVKNSEQTIDDPDVAQKLKERYKQEVAGLDVLLTGMDWDINVLGVPADQAAFVETMKLNATQVAAIYGVPPEEIGGTTGSSMTYKTLEQQEQRFYGRVIRPWATRIEQHLTALLPRGQYVRFNLDAQVRADILARYQAHQIGLTTGIETLDEARALEERPPLTPEQIAEWQELYGSTPPAPEANPTGSGGSTSPGGTDGQPAN
jgi:HK97 family phage portal protein